LKKFTTLSLVVIAFLFAVISAFVLIYRYFTIGGYNMVILTGITFAVIITVITIMAIVAIFLTYKKKRAIASLGIFVKIGLYILMPIISFVSDILRHNKDVIRKFYIDVNNILVESGKLKFSAKDILLVLPHCLQNYECRFKITRDIAECKKCGKCNIGDIKDIADKTGINVAVVTGGTAARNIIIRLKPKMIIAVACERDLTSGILDVKSICVLGVLNQRPNGPCYNTLVDVDLIREKINSVLVNSES